MSTLSSDRTDEPDPPWLPDLHGLDAATVRGLVEQLPEALAVIVGPEHLYLAASAAYRQVIGGREPRGRRFREVLPELADQGFEQLLDRVYRTGEPQSGTAQPVRWDADGDGVPEERRVDFTYQPLRDARGEVWAVAALVTDVTAQKQAEVVLRESEAQFRTLANSIPQLAWMADAEGWIFWYNQRWYEYTGTTLDEMEGWGWRAVHHPDHLDRVVDRFRGSIAAGESWEDIFPLRGADGEYRWFLSRALPIRDEQGRVVRWFGTNTDVTEQRETEAALRTSEQRYRLVTRATNDVIWDWDQRTDAVLWGEAVHAVLGYAPGAVGESAEWWYEHIHPADRERVVDSIHAVLDGGGETWEGEYRFRRADGGYAHVYDRGYVARDAAGVPTRMIGAMQDVTDQRRAERANRFLAEVTELLSRSLHVDVTLRRLTETVVPTLADWCAVDRLEPDGSIRRLAVAHTDPARRRLALELTERYPIDPSDAGGVAAVIRTGEPDLVPEIPDALLEQRARDPDHLRLLRELDLRSYLIVPIETGGERFGALVLVQGASDRRFSEADLPLAREVGRRAGVAIQNSRLYEQAERARAEAERANQVKMEFLSAMSHELRTPLNAIGGYVDLIDAGIHGPVTEPQRAALDRVKRAQELLLVLINDILNFARIEAGRIEYRREPVELAALVERLEPLVGSQMERKQIAFSHRVPAGLSACADPERVQQVLLNLLTNATKFTDSGGRVELRAARVGEQVRVQVADTGRGIARERLQSIFEPFVQVDRQRLEDSQQGVGLGLAISRELARAMSGELEVESEAGKGSTFTLTLPAD